MSTSQSSKEKMLFDALQASPNARETGWGVLFDPDGSLIKSEIDELEFDPMHPHPLHAFYEEYTGRLLGRGRSVFTPYDVTIPVIDAPPLQQVFGSLGMQARFPAFKLAGARSKYRLDPISQTIGILTAGGNAPGINTVIDSIVKRHSLLATAAGASREQSGSIRGLTIWGYEGGYVGLVKGKKVELNVSLTDKASLQPGSLLKVLRGETPKDRASARRVPTEQAQEELAIEMAKAVARDGLDILYAVGGNGTITAANEMSKHLTTVNGRHGYPVRIVAAPKTMDNDVHFTDVTFGFRTTVENAVEVIERIHLEAETCGRIAVVELFGAGSGFVALHASYSSGEVDYVLIPEMLQGQTEDKKLELERTIERLATRFKKNGHAILVVAEGATAASPACLGEFIHGAHGAKQKAFESLVEYLQERLKQHFPGTDPPQIFTNRPRHLIRSTAPTSDDVDLCKQTGKLMVDTALAGMSRCVVSLWRNRFVLVPMNLATTTSKRVDVGSYYFLSMMEKYLLSDSKATGAALKRAEQVAGGTPPEIEFDLLF